MDEIIRLLLEVDRILNSMSVSGDNVFAVCNARKLLKYAYDKCNTLNQNETENKGGEQNG